MSIENWANAAPPVGLADRLWARTEALHRQAERTGVLRDLLRGHAAREPYALLLRNLLPVYEALERELEAHGRSRLLAPLARRDVYRADPLRSDLRRLDGAALPVLPSASRYADRIAAAADRDGSLLIAHAYVRYLGDLNGGQILKRLLAKHLGLGAESLTFYDFASDPDVLAKAYRTAIDAAGAAITDPEAIAEEACAAFRMNIALSEEVQAAGIDPTPPLQISGDT